MTAAGQIGPYTVVRTLARGGMAQLYLVTRTGGGPRLSVLKQIRDCHADVGRYQRMFRDEIRLAARLCHPNIVRLLDASLDCQRPYYIMEFIVGVNLGRLQLLADERSRRLPLELVISVIRDAARALHHAHELVDDDGRSLDVVHRDICPSNVMIGAGGRVKVIDFGVAKSARREHRTVRRVVKGHVGYMSPEQVKGSGLDRRSDLFSLGILLYELSTGWSAYHGNDYEILRSTAHVPVAPPSRAVAGYPPQLESIVVRALQLDPADRYQTAAELAADLDSLAAERHYDLTRQHRRRLLVGLLRRPRAALRAGKTRETAIANRVP